MPIIDTGPLSLSELLDRMFAIYRRYFLILVGTAAMPFLLLIPAGAILGAGVYAGMRGGYIGMIGAGTTIVTALIFGAVYLVSYCLSWISITAAVWQIQLGHSPTILGAYRTALPKVWKAALAGLLFGLIVGVGFVLLIVPGILFELAFCLIGPVIIAENAGPIVALSRSWDVTKDYRGKIFVVALICVGISWVMASIFQFPFQLVSIFIYKGGGGPIWFIVLSGLCSVVGAILPAPLQTTALCLVYYDARVRKEGFDLQRMIDSLAQPAPGAAQAPLAG
jgi:hypothetical protein